MTRVLITGGTGALGSKIASMLDEQDYTVRIMSRSASRLSTDSKREWAQAQLETGEGLEAAVQGVDIIVHCASSSLNSQKIDVEGTRALLKHASKAGVKHIQYISIVGIEKFPKFSYYKGKLATEKVIEESGVPYTILRATQFHGFIDMLIGLQRKLPVMVLPTDFQCQPIDGGEVAAHMVSLLKAGPSGHAADIGGPEILRVGDMIEAWKKVQGIRKPVFRMPLWGHTAQSYRDGLHTCPDQRFGKISWAEWLQRTYGKQQATNSEARKATI